MYLAALAFYYGAIKPNNILPNNSVQSASTYKEATEDNTVVRVPPITEITGRHRK